MSKQHIPNSFECHITLEPTSDAAAIAQIDLIASAHGFKRAALYYSKDGKLAPDMFLNGKDSSYDRLDDRGDLMIRDLSKAGFDIKRYKVEGILLDVRT